MQRVATIASLVVSASILASCNQQRASNFCEVIRQGPKLAGSIVDVHAWHGSASFWSALGSGECDQLIQPDFNGVVDVTTNGPKSADAGRAIETLRRKPVINVPFDFSGDFRGVLGRRTGYYPSGPVPLDAAPALDDMPYVLHVTSIRNLQIVPNAPWKKPPPPPPSHHS